jgi:hypothetical protein
MPPAADLAVPARRPAPGDARQSLLTGSGRAKPQVRGGRPRLGAVDFVTRSVSEGKEHTAGSRGGLPFAPVFEETRLNQQAPRPSGERAKKGRLVAGQNQRAGQPKEPPCRWAQQTLGTEGRQSWSPKLS